MRVLNRDGEWVEEDDSSLPLPKRASEDLLAIARYQKAILVCILVQLGVVAGLVVIPPQADVLVGVASLGVAIAQAVFMFLLAVRIFGVRTGIALSILTLLPCLGLIMLLFVNGRASATLRANGIRVGLLGASGHDLRRVRAEHGPSGGSVQ